MRHFFAQVAGESHRNDDGSDRQTIIQRCRVGELLALEHEPDNPHDINAIRVLRRSREQIGYLTREFAGEVVSRSAKGWRFHAIVAGFGRAGGSGPYGVALLIVVENEDADDGEVLGYARRVLDEEVGAGVRPVTSRERSSRPASKHREGDPWTRWLLIGAFSLLAIAVAIGWLFRVAPPWSWESAGGPSWTAAPGFVRLLGRRVLELQLPQADCALGMGGCCCPDRSRRGEG